MFLGEPEEETKKPEKHAIYVEFLLRSSRFVKEYDTRE